MVQGTQRLTQKLVITVLQRVPKNIVHIGGYFCQAPAQPDIPQTPL